MKTIDLKKMNLPLTKKKFNKLRDGIRTRRVKWMDMSNELMYAYQDFWKFQRSEKMNDMIDE